MKEQPIDPSRRPSCVFWAGVIFWVMPVVLVVTHGYLALEGTVIGPAFLTAGVLLCAAVLWLVRPRWHITFCVGLAALVTAMVWAGATMRAQYVLHSQFPQIAPQVLGSLIFLLAVAGITYRYVFGMASRRYFLWE